MSRRKDRRRAGPEAPTMDAEVKQTEEDLSQTSDVPAGAPDAEPPSANSHDQSGPAAAAAAPSAIPPGPPPEAAPRALNLAPGAASAVPASEAAVVVALEERVRRLEDSLAHLQQMQGRVTQAVAQIQCVPVAAAANRSPSTDFLLDMGRRLLSPPEPAPATPAAATTSAPSAATHGPMWLVLDTLAEARAIFHMFVDPRYRLPWPGRIVPLVLLAAILTSYFWVPLSSITVVGYWINKIVDLLLAFILFKVLGHEARRYRQTSPDLPSHLRL